MLRILIVALVLWVMCLAPSPDGFPGGMFSRGGTAGALPGEGFLGGPDRESQRSHGAGINATGMPRPHPRLERRKRALSRSPRAPGAGVPEGGFLVCAVVHKRC